MDENQLREELKKYNFYHIIQINKQKNTGTAHTSLRLTFRGEAVCVNAPFADAI
jgi:hypothetical protein